MEWACSPLGILIIWAVLHGADYLLTIAVARTFARGDLRSRIELGRSVELNPVFQRAVDRGAWVSRRFVVSLVAVGAALSAVFALLRTFPPPEREMLSSGAELLVGVLVVTRVVVITGHLQSLALFRRLLRNPAAAGVVIRYDRGTVFTARRWSYGPSIALCALAAATTGSVFFAGGLVGMVGLLLATLAWQRVEARRAPPTPAVAPPPSRGSFPAT